MRGYTRTAYSFWTLVLINFLAVVYNAAIYLFATHYAISKGFAYSLLSQLEAVPKSPSLVFLATVFLYTGLLGIFYHHQQQAQPFSIFDRLTMLEVFLTLALFFTLSMSYNGLFLVVFADVFYGSKEFAALKNRKYWVPLLGLSLLLLTDYNLLSLFVASPSLVTYIRFCPPSLQVFLLFGKNFLFSINLLVFILSLIFSILETIQEKQKIEEELRLAAQANRELNSYLTLSEKIAEDRERKRIAREIHDTLGHALTGISAGLDAVRVLVDRDRIRAKEQLDNISVVVRDGIRDVRASLHKMRPGDLEHHSLKEALLKTIREYEALSNIEIVLDFQWDRIDLDIAKEDIVFRIIQESITNAVRHGHARSIRIELLERQDYVMIIQDDGVGFEELYYGYGLRQMEERLAIIGGRVHFENRNGFYTYVTIPRMGGEYD